jgi:chemosensory pili system protein ChpA (sensor histidine kinase/response regulator)
MYQFAAAGFIRSVNTDENLAYLQKVFQRLHKLTQGTARQPLWDICLALSEALEMDAIESSVSIKTLLRQLDKEIKLLVQHGVKALDSFSDEELVQNLLYYVARSGKHAPGFPVGSHLKHIYELYQLEQALPEGREAGEESRSMLSAPDSGAMRSVVEAIKGELELIKQALDASLVGDDREQVLADALPVVKRVADTMAVLGIGDLRKQVLEQGAVLEMVVDSGSKLSGEQLMAVAGKVLEIENRLDMLVENTGRGIDDHSASEADLNLSRAYESVLRESRNGLEHAKDAIVEYVASQWDREHLKVVPATLREIRGGLEMVPLPRPARILGACARCIEEQLLNGERPPEWSWLDTLADAITSVEYYLERFGNERDEENELLLIVAEDSVASLGYAVAKTSRPIPEPQMNEVQVSEAEDLSAAYQAALGNAPDEQYQTEADSLPMLELEEEEFEPAAPREPFEANSEPAPEAGQVDGYSYVTLEQHIKTVDDEEPAAAAAAPIEPDPVVDAVDDDYIDDEILEIFIEEAGEVAEAINEYFPLWAKNLADNDALTEFRRAFHTLKGSGRMVGAIDIGELAWSIENMLNRIIDGTAAAGAAHVVIIEKVRQLLPAMIEAFRLKQSNPHRELTERYQAQAQALARGEVPDDLGVDDAVLISTEAGAAPVDSQFAVEDDDEPDGQLWDIFGVEALAHLKVVEGDIEHMEEEAPLYTPPSEDTQRALHTLKGSAHMADIVQVAELVTPLERFVKELRTYQVNINDDILQLLRDAVSYTHVALEQIEQGETIEIPRLHQFVARVNELRELSVGHLARQSEAAASGKKTIDPELLAIFMAEEMNLLLDADQIIEQWRLAPENLKLLEPLQEELANLTYGAKHANLPPMADLGEKLQQIYRMVVSRQLNCSDELCSTLHAAHGSLLDMVDAVAVGQNVAEPPELVARALAQFLDVPVPMEPEWLEQEWGAAQDAETAPEEDDSIEMTPASDPPASEQEVASDTPVDSEQPSHEDWSEDWSLPMAEVEEDADNPVQESTAEPHISESPDVVAVQSASGEEDEYDSEIMEIVLEEAIELLEDIERAVHDWQEDWNNSDYTEELKRALHTLKGGARLAGITDLGDLAHDYESMLIGMDSTAEIDQNFFKQLHDYQDQLHAGIERMRGGVLAASEAVAEKAADSGSLPDDRFASEMPSSAEGPAHPADDDKANVLPFTPKPRQTAPAPVQDSGGALRSAVPGGGNVQHLAARRSGPQEVVKVSADLLEELVNLAGETAISRGRMEEQVSDLGMSIGEMDATILRLQEQLRRLDIETEAQVLFRQEQLGAHEDFDPLEMDRYSQLQQLSRSLIESASDLMDLKSTLSDKNRDTETLLLQQSRINTDLQEGLMRSRMVPFSRLVPRLRRIVRQAATELGKEVSFELDNVEGELDRSVLERMVAPLEHMLRNAVDHGIEPAEERRRAGKPEAGRIVLSLGREGGDVLLRLADDGRGIDLEKVREKAVERGLMNADAELSDQDVMQFILHAGFSTADKVTQISGRGVGMDVVHSEIKQLGGAMFIDSYWGKGTEFIVRLPFTVSVNRALMVQIGDDQYAVPLNSIEGIVRISPFELEHYYQEERARFEYANENYLVRYLGTLLDSMAQPKLDGQSLPLPVILVRSTEHTVALQVDRLLGSREIVVKTLGAQFSAVRGVSGATVTGDGSVVVILDLHAVIREQLALGMARATLLQPFGTGPAINEDADEKTVMVVDDSVTVRKVTSRFLEREGFNVITAKDGAEALLLLQDHMPDVMLLDIEMPRMDGFEVAKNVRSSSRLKHLPIIMITSRTGEKHRERALGLGVNRYMGKPYQEDLLLNNINELLKETVD